MAKTKDAKNDPLSVGRHTGEYIWGYEVMSDGRIVLSPGFADQFRTILDTETGLYAMQEGVARYVAQELARTAKRRREWWDHLQDDLGVPIEKGGGWMFDGREGSVSRQEPPKDKPE